MREIEKVWSVVSKVEHAVAIANEMELTDGELCEVRLDCTHTIMGYGGITARMSIWARSFPNLVDREHQPMKLCCMGDGRWLRYAAVA